MLLIGIKYIVGINHVTVSYRSDSVIAISGAIAELGISVVCVYSFIVYIITIPCLYSSLYFLPCRRTYRLAAVFCSRRFI